MHRTIFHIIAGLGDGGAEAVLYRLCSSSQGFKHVVVSLMNEGKYGPLLRAAGVEVVCLNMKRGALSFKGVWMLWKMLKRAKPFAVQTWMYHANLLGGVAAFLAGVRRISWGIHHTDLNSSYTKRSTIFVAKLCALLSKLVPDDIVFCAEHAREIHEKIGYERGKLRVIANGCDVTLFSPDAIQRSIARGELIASEMPVIGMVGRFDPIKDHENLFRALAIVESRGISFCCVLVGSGMDEENEVLINLRDRFKISQKMLRLLGRRDKVHQIMRALDVHLLSSRSEAFPNVLIEAMACGVPCVTTDVGDARAMVADTGWVVDPADSDALANALITSLTMRPEELRDLGKRARDRVIRCYSIEKMVQSYQTLWTA